MTKCLDLFILAFFIVSLQSVVGFIAYGENWTIGWVEIFYMLCQTITICVNGYFVTFRYCWDRTLYWMSVMIGGYCDLLSVVVERLTSWPTNLIFTCGAIVLFFITYLIIRQFRYHHIPPTDPEISITKKS